MSVFTPGVPKFAKSMKTTTDSTLLVLFLVLLRPYHVPEHSQVAIVKNSAIILWSLLLLLLLSLFNIPATHSSFRRLYDNLTITTYHKLPPEKKSLFLLLLQDISKVPLFLMNQPIWSSNLSYVLLYSFISTRPRRSKHARWLGSIRSQTHKRPAKDE